MYESTASSRTCTILTASAKQAQGTVKDFCLAVQTCIYEQIDDRMSELNSGHAPEPVGIAHNVLMEAQSTNQMSGEMRPQ